MLEKLPWKERQERLAGHAVQETQRWQACAYQALRLEPFGAARIHHPVKDSLSYVASPVEAEHLGKRFAWLVRACEAYHASKLEVNMQQVWRTRPSRAKGPWFRQVDARTYRTNKPCLHQMAIHPLHRWWAVFTTRLTVLITYRSQDGPRRDEGGCDIPRTPSWRRRLRYPWTPWWRWSSFW